MTTKGRISMELRIPRHSGSSFAVALVSIVAACSMMAGTPGRLFPSPASHRIDVLLDTAWRFSRLNLPTGPEAPTYEDVPWDQVNLPHTWNNLDGQDGGNDYYRGIGWYRRHVVPDPSLAGRRLFLQFDGANIVTDVYVNGTRVGEHRGGFAAFRFDVTSHLRAGEDNLIAVKVSNAPDPDVPPLDADFTFFGGLYRHVHLLATDALALTCLDYGSDGVYVRQVHVNAASARLEIVSLVSNASETAKHGTIRTTLVDANGSVVRSLTTRRSFPAASTERVTQTMTVRRPHLWDGRKDPYLYAVWVEVVEGATPVDVVREPLGIRYFSVDPDRGFFLNGRPYDLHGVNKHQDRLNKGWAINETDMDEDFSLIMEVGATAVRLAHYQHPAHEYDLADRLGLVVWAEIPLVNRITASDAFAQNAEQQLIELIRQNYNHPSIVFWSIANEITLQHGPDPAPLLRDLAGLAHREDAGRLSAIASAADDTNRTSHYTDVAGFNKYFGWYVGTMEDFAPWADGIHANPVLRDRKIGVTEYGAGASIRFHSADPKRGDHTEEYQCLYHETYWKAMKSRPFLWGKFVWNMFDFAVDGRDEGDTNGRNDKGLVTYDRKTRKDSFFWYKSNWTDEPMVYITSRRFTPRKDSTITIKVYSNVDPVELKLNGASLGKRTGNEHRFVWTGVGLSPGDNVVEATGSREGIVVRDSLTWQH